MLKKTFIFFVIPVLFGSTVVCSLGSIDARSGEVIQSIDVAGAGQ